MMVRRALLAIVAAGQLGCGLYSEGACGSQRSLTVDQPAPDLLIHFMLVDEAERADVLSWQITAQNLSNVSAVHLHDATPGGGDRMLYDFTTADPDPAPGFTVAGSTEYSFDTGIDNIFTLVRTGRTYIDVHTSPDAPPAARVDITNVQFEDWSEYYCS